MKKILVSLSEISLDILNTYKAKGISNSSLINLALTQFKGELTTESPQDKSPIEAIEEFIAKAPDNRFPTKHFLTTADKIWIENYQIAKSKGGTLDPEGGWVEFSDIPVPDWYPGTLASEEV